MSFLKCFKILFTKISFCFLFTSSTTESNLISHPTSIEVLINAFTSFGKQEPPYPIPENKNFFQSENHFQFLFALNQHQRQLLRKICNFIHISNSHCEITIGNIFRNLSTCNIHFNNSFINSKKWIV